MTCCYTRSSVAASAPVLDEPAQWTYTAPVAAAFNPHEPRIPGGEHGGEWSRVGAAVKKVMRAGSPADLHDEATLRVALGFHDEHTGMTRPNVTHVRSARLGTAALRRFAALRTAAARHVGAAVPTTSPTKRACIHDGLFLQSRACKAKASRPAIAEFDDHASVSRARHPTRSRSSAQSLTSAATLQARCRRTTSPNSASSVDGRGRSGRR